MAISQEKKILYLDDPSSDSGIFGTILKRGSIEFVWIHTITCFDHVIPLSHGKTERKGKFPFQDPNLDTFWRRFCIDNPMEIDETLPLRYARAIYAF